MRNTKEKVITIGVVISFFIFLALSIRFACAGGYAIILSFLSILIPVAVFKGVRFGYTLGRFVFGGLAILLPGGALTSFSYEDAMLARASYVHTLGASLLIAIIFVFLFYCLGEHIKLRNLK
jgi:hypothetical protein